MVISEAIILAGGLGTRLRSAVPDLPKCMAPVNGDPFLKYVIEYLQSQKVEHFIFSLGYKHEVITDYLKTNFQNLSVKTSIEDEPLGTGGAIQLALKEAQEKSVIVTNGDTLFKVDLHQLSSAHFQHNSNCTLCLRPMTNFSRYGAVEIDENSAIKSFKEKDFYKEGLINGGIYALDKESFLQQQLPQKFSFEKDYLEAYYQQKQMFGIVQDEYFIDIGIPEDYNRAQTELK